MKKSITNNYIYNLIYQLLVILVPVFTTPYLTRTLGSEKLAIFGFTYSIVTIFFLLSALGINTYGQREIAYVQNNKEKRSQIFWELVIIRFLSTLISIILLLLFICIIHKYSIYYQIFLLYIIANFFDITWFYQGIENFKNIAIRNIIIKLLYCISIFIFIKSPKDINTYIILFSSMTLITNITFWINIQKYVTKFNIKKINIKKHIKPVIVLFIPQIASLIYTVLDKTMIGIIMPDIRNVYYYEQATYIVKTILTLITTIGTVMVSRIANTYETKDFKKIEKYLSNTVNFVWLLGCPLCFGICATIGHFVPWFYGKEYIPIIPLVHVLSCLIIIIGLNNIIGIQFLVATKKQNKYIFAVICGAIINFILNSLLIPVIGTIGAAIASIIAEISILLIELHDTRKVIKNFSITSSSYKYICYGIIMFLITYLVGTILPITIISLMIQIMIGGCTYFLLLIITNDQFFNIYILQKIKKIIKKRRT